MATKFTEKDIAELEKALAQNQNRNKDFKGLTRKGMAELKFKSPEKYGIPSSADSLRYTPKVDDKPVKYFDSRLGRYLAFKTEEDKASYLAHPTNKPKEPKPPKKTQAQKDAEKAEAIRLKNEADPIGHISDIQKKIDDAKTLRRKTKEGSPERAQYDNIINTLTSKQDSIRNTNPKFNLKSLVKNLNKAVKVSSTTKVVPKTKTAKVEPKVYKSMEDARRLIKGQEKKDVRALATKIQREEGISRDEAWTKALTISNIQFNK